MKLSSSAYVVVLSIVFLTGQSVFGANIEYGQWLGVSFRHQGPFPQLSADRSWSEVSPLEASSTGFSSLGTCQPGHIRLNCPDRQYEQRMAIGQQASPQVLSLTDGSTVLLPPLKQTQ